MIYAGHKYVYWSDGKRAATRIQGTIFYFQLYNRITAPLCCSVVISSQHQRMHQLLGMGSDPGGLIVAQKRSVNKTCCARGFDCNVGLKTKYVLFKQI